MRSVVDVMVAAPQSTQTENDETIESLVLPAPTTGYLILVAGSRGYSIRGTAHVRNIASPPVKRSEIIAHQRFPILASLSHVVNARIRHVERAVDEAAFEATPLRLVILEFVRYAEAGQRIRHGE